MLRAIHIFPEFSNVQSINAIRSKYDPLARLIPPHVTLVFPFESDDSTEMLVEHVQESMTGVKPFRLVMTGVTGAEGEYLFLNVKVGNDQIIQLHDKMYTGLLKRYLYRALTYTPHLTVGRVKDRQRFESALAETENLYEIYETTVHQVVIERIGENEDSIIETLVALPR